jgi:histidine triad (HIT) family protein
MEHSPDTSAVHCTFCDLIRGSAEVSVCHEDSDAIAFMDIQPVNNGHVLVVPREHYESLLDVPEEIGLHLFRVTMRLANAVRRVTGCEDFNIVVNSGAAAGQDEPHYHVHIIPRREGDGFDIPLPFNGSSMPDRTVLDAYAAQIISALRDPMRGAPTISPLHDHVVRRSPDRAPGAAIPTGVDAGGRPLDVQHSLSPSDTNWEIQEGAHGEIVYDRPRSSDGTS